MEYSSITFTLSGNSSILEANYFPPIQLDLNKTYVLGLIQLSTFNSIPNIDVTNNNIKVGKDEITLPVGSYELEDIEDFIKKSLIDKETKFSLKANNNTLKSIIQSNKTVDLQVKNSIHRVLGFSNILLEPNKFHTSSLNVKILKVNTIRVECNITTGAYINNKSVHTIHEFFPSVPPGYRIVEAPKTVIYLPINVQAIDFIQLKIVDQDNELINFRNETITIRLHLKVLE
jgi:hypothetical protein